MYLQALLSVSLHPQVIYKNLSQWQLMLSCVHAVTQQPLQCTLNSWFKFQVKTVGLAELTSGTKFHNRTAFATPTEIPFLTKAEFSNNSVNSAEMCTIPQPSSSAGEKGNGGTELLQSHSCLWGRAGWVCEDSSARAAAPKAQFVLQQWVSVKQGWELPGST